METDDHKLMDTVAGFFFVLFLVLWRTLVFAICSCGRFFCILIYMKFPYPLPEAVAVTVSVADAEHPFAVHFAVCGKYFTHLFRFSSRK